MTTQRSSSTQWTSAPCKCVVLGLPWSSGFWMMWRSLCRLSAHPSVAGKAHAGRVQAPKGIQARCKPGLEQLHDVQCGAFGLLALLRLQHDASTPTLALFCAQEGSEYYVVASRLKTVFEEKYSKMVRDDGSFQL